MATRVGSLRRLLLDHRALALWLALAALAVKLLVPAGFMVGTIGGRVALQLCSGFGPATAAAAAAPMMTHAVPMAHAMPGDKAGPHDGKADHAGADMPCPFTALAHGTVTPVDPVLLALALAFALALGFAATSLPRARAIPHLRPPLRGPPIPV